MSVNSKNIVVEDSKKLIILLLEEVVALEFVEFEPVDAAFV